MATLKLNTCRALLHYSIHRFLPATYQGVDAKGFYLLLYTVALRTLSLSPLNLYQNRPPSMKISQNACRYP